MFKWINKLKNKKGFTLIELIVVLAVLGIIALIAIPRFLSVQEQAKIDADYGTAAGIAKAAELYYVQAGTASMTAVDTKWSADIDDMSSDGYIDSWTGWQSSEETEVYILIDPAGGGTVEVYMDDTDLEANQLYPDTRTE
ncbi:MSHA pilin protein MshA [Dethiosulfatibacter aminovorans DSM 17477]|uniref:MSHA pilin protein MshA n=1 Tax=Dethiosulfatibacter aminovorans DSM 17477 TaxID=1121476 RepID=A0A1M6D799_9FIRM|nr:prepilin-type N-terminal cleavage/methylation domain-containing protein [Dethiosulfatibacter aminovorans]SHI69102.1 MSHA pilin protein MshA [Dethiosulfatibacter aminovorans DSM 17477]